MKSRESKDASARLRQDLNLIYQMSLCKDRAACATPQQAQESAAKTYWFTVRRPSIYVNRRVPSTGSLF